MHTWPEVFDTHSLMDCSFGSSCVPHVPMCISFIRYLACGGPMHRSNGPKYDFRYKISSSMVLLRAFSQIVRSLMASSGRILFLLYSWIGVIQVLVASSINALTSVISTDRSLSSLISTPFVSPSHCTAASLIKVSAFLFSSLVLLKMRMEQYLQCIDYTLWEIVENGNAPIVTKTVDGKEIVIPPTSVEEKEQRRA
ncbi:hypothetical protein Tco_0534020 [Tanacetum coccineum]